MIGVKPQNAFGLLPGAPPLARVRPSSFVGRSAGALEWELQRARGLLKKRNTTTSNFNRIRFVCVCVCFLYFYVFSCRPPTTKEFLVQGNGRLFEHRCHELLVDFSF